MNVTRRHFVKAAAATVAAGLALPLAADGNIPRQESREIYLPDLLPAHDGLKVAQLSDLHVGPRTPTKLLRLAIEMVNNQAPDLVVLTGDYLCADRRGVGLIGEELGGLRAPTVAVLGNHDHRVDPRGARVALERLG